MDFNPGDIIYDFWSPQQLLSHEKNVKSEKLLAMTRQHPTTYTYKTFSQEIINCSSLAVNWEPQLQYEVVLLHGKRRGIQMDVFTHSRH